jgi:outer membrane protein TolC
MRFLEPIALVVVLIACGGGCFSRAASESWKFDDLALASFDEPLPTPAPIAESATRPASATPLEPIRLDAIRRLEDLRPDQTRPLLLDELLRAVVANNAVVLDDRQFMSPGNEVLVNPEAAPSVFDSSIQQSSAGGADAALAAFDLQAATGGQWGENSLTRSNGFLTGIGTPTDILVAKSGSLYGRLDKPMPTGGVASLVHAWNYVPNNLASQTFNSRFAGFLRGELRQPLLAGSGREFTEVAGPISRINPNPGRGVAIARLDQNITVAEFESRLHLLLKQTYEVYLDLWLAHELYRVQLAAAASAEDLRIRVDGRGEMGLHGGEAANRAYAEENVFERRRMVDDALAAVLEVENRLRRLTGLPLNDGQLLAPVNQPLSAQFVADWDGVLSTAMLNRLELRRQQMRIQSLALQCRAARNLARPQLDLVAGAQLNGEGEELVSGSGGSSAYDALLDPDRAGWNVGFEFSMPLGLRLANARVRNFEERLIKARAAFEAQQEEISHELANVFYELDRTQAAVGTATGRREAARRRFQAVESDYNAGRTSLDLLLRTYVAVADAERAYLESLVAYNKAIVELNYRQGVLLRDNCIAIADVDKTSGAGASTY